MKEEKRIIFYENEGEEFSKAKITPMVIDENYPYQHGWLWEIVSTGLQNIFSMPIKWGYAKGKFALTFVRKRKTKAVQKYRVFHLCESYTGICRYFYSFSCQLPKKKFFSGKSRECFDEGTQKTCSFIGCYSSSR